MLSFVIMFAISYLVVLLVINLFNNVFHFPLLRHFDWFLGGLFGAVRGYFVVMLILAVVPLGLSVLPLDIVQKMIDASALKPYFSASFFNTILMGVIGSAFPKAT